MIDEILSTDMLAVKKWEWLKYKVRKHTIEFSKQRKLGRENKLLLYEKKLEQYKLMLVKIHSKDADRDRVLLHSKEILDKIKDLERE